MSMAPDRHAREVRRIANELQSRTSTTPVSLRKRTVAHQVPKSGDRRRYDDKIDISQLHRILSIDPTARICVAEPGVTFVDLVDATLKHGLLPIVVPELKTITIGGAVSGCSIESMSFEYGGFHDTCLEYEVITAKGDVLVCRRDNEHALVFEMMHGSFGTLGIVSKLTFRLVPAKPFVRLVHERYTTLAAYQEAITRHAEARDLDFMDGIIHSPSLYVLCTGHFVDRALYTSRYDWMRVYYKSTASRSEDFMTTADYVFRYDRGVTNVRPKSFLGRLLFGKMLSSTQMLRLGNKLHWLLKTTKPTVTVDLFLPMSKVPEFLAWYERELDFYPLWCVPYRRVHDYEWLAPSFYAGMTDTMFLDLAIYGMKQRSDNDHRLIEKKLEELGGIKTLISHNYYDKDEFWSIFNKPNYDAVKAITDPNNIFRDLYTKMCRAAMGHED
jgi:FAD/FMN-containing dehydrogenase